MDLAVTALHQLTMSHIVEFSCILGEKDLECIKTSVELGKISQWENYNEKVNWRL